MNAQLFHTENRASVAQILAHLRSCDAFYVPVLSRRVSLEQYAAQLHGCAVRFEFWHGEVLVAMAALDLAAAPVAVLENISVLPAFARQGLATRLLQYCVAAAQAKGFETLALRVSVDNRAAYALYAQHGFRLAGQEAAMCRLEKPL